METSVVFGSPEEGLWIAKGGGSDAIGGANNQVGGTCGEGWGGGLLNLSVWLDRG